MQETPLFTLAEAARHLDVEESVIREWLSTFNWERHYDGQGTTYLSAKDVEFLRVIKGLKDVDRSCDSIVRIIGNDDELVATVPAAPDLVEAPETAAVEEAEPAAEPHTGGLEQIETLKAELLELHARPAKKKPFWKFW